MKSRVIKYGKTVIILLCIMFAVCVAACCLPWVDNIEAAAIWTEYGSLATAVGAIMGLTIARYGARETAASLKGSFRPEMIIKRED